MSNKMVLGILNKDNYKEALKKETELVGVGRIDDNSGVFWVNSFDDLATVKKDFGPGEYHLVKFDLPVEYDNSVYYLDNKQIGAEFLGDVFRQMRFSVRVKIETILTFVVVE
jgi:hypothetical protein